MFNSELRLAIREKLDAGLTHQQVYEQLAVEGEDNQAIVRLLMRMPSKANFDSTIFFRKAIQYVALAYVLFGFYFINNVLRPSLSQPYGLWIQFVLFAAAMVFLFGFVLQKNVLPNFITLVIPIAYFSFLNKIIPQQFTVEEIINVVLFLLLFITEIVYTFKLKKGIVLEMK